jgi:hypothetical protein
MRSTCYLLLDPWPPFCIRIPETPLLNCRAGFSFRARRKSAPQSLLSLSFTLHDRTTRATGSTMRESFPARGRQYRPPPSRCPSSGGRLDRATIRSDSTSVARSWPVIRRKSDSTMRAALIYVVGSIAVFYLLAARVIGRKCSMCRTQNGNTTLTLGCSARCCARRVTYR